MSIEIDHCDSCDREADPNDDATIDGAFWCAKCWSDQYVRGHNHARLVVDSMRQARTIRRLFTLYLGYRSHADRIYQDYNNALTELHFAEETATALEDASAEAGADQERARIVAALGASVWTGSLYPPEVHAAVQAIRDAIERGEL